MAVQGTGDADLQRTKAAQNQICAVLRETRWWVLEEHGCAGEGEARPFVGTGSMVVQCLRQQILAKDLVLGRLTMQPGS